jgi:two-component system sensor histidine kinase KdpD
VAKFWQNPAVRSVVAAFVVAAVTGVYSVLLHVNPTTVGFTFLLAVLVVAAAWGLSYAVFMAILATLAYNYFFLPPIGRFTVADPQNWVALAAFLMTAVIASNLAERARRETLNANRRRYDLERLYSLSQQLLATDNILELLNAIPARIASIFGAREAAIYLSEGNKAYYSSLAAQSPIPGDELRAVAVRGEPAGGPEKVASFVPLRLGVRSVGALGVAGGNLSREILEAVASLIAIAIERARAIEKLTHTEAARESEKLRAVLLDSVTHEFRTPLTSILASAKALLSNDPMDESGRRDLLSVINEEGERLNRLVGEAAEMAQLDAHQVELQFRPYQMREVIEGALEDASRALKEHPVEVHVPDNLPRVRMDGKRIQEVLTHLLDNAGKYSPAGTPIHITVEMQDGVLRTSVADHGPGIDEFEQGLIFEKFYRGQKQRVVQGTGMGLAIVKAILEAHGGTVGVTSQLGHGSVFYFTLPLT